MKQRPSFYARAKGSYRHPKDQTAMMLWGANKQPLKYSDGCSIFIPGRLVLELSEIGLITVIEGRATLECSLAKLTNVLIERGAVAA